MGRPPQGAGLERPTVVQIRIQSWGWMQAPEASLGLIIALLVMVPERPTANPSWLWNQGAEEEPGREQ